MKYAMRAASFLLVIWLISCVSLTVNVYFPTKEIEEAAETIEERVRSGRGIDNAESSYLPEAPRGLRFAVGISFGPKTAYALDSLNIDIDTPAVRAIIKSRTERYEKLEPHLDSGVFGEGMEGFLVLRRTEGFDLRTLNQLRTLVRDENNDRTRLYQEILRANRLETNKANMERIGRTFFRAIVRKMKAGQWYQVDIEEDKWEQKKEEDEENR